MRSNNINGRRGTKTSFWYEMCSKSRFQRSCIKTISGVSIYFFNLNKTLLNQTSSKTFTLKDHILLDAQARRLTRESDDHSQSDHASIFLFFLCTYTVNNVYLFIFLFCRMLLLSSGVLQSIWAWLTATSRFTVYWFQKREPDMPI